jgi:hypothetical protein
LVGVPVGVGCCALAVAAPPRARTVTSTRMVLVVFIDVLVLSGWFKNAAAGEKIRMMVARTP